VLSAIAPMGRLISLVNPRERSEKQPVARHRVEQSRFGHHQRVEGAECRYQNQRRDDRTGRGTDGPCKGVGGDTRRRRHIRDRQHIEVCGVRGQIHDDDEEQARHQRPRNRFTWIADLARERCKLCPPVIAKEHRGERDAETTERWQDRRRAWIGERAAAFAENENRRRKPEQRQNLRGRPDGLDRAGQTNGFVVDDAHQHDQSAGNQPCAQLADVDERPEITREHQRDRRLREWKRKQVDPAEHERR
jgi:hypothetical protein